MKTILVFFLSLVGCLGQSVNLTNLPSALTISTNDKVLGLTNVSPNIALSKTRLISVQQILDLGTNYDNIFAVNIYGSIFYLSNSLAMPTAATLGVGGYWVGNSNGNLVTVYSLDGLTTVMKILAP